ncbi:AMP-binding protein [Flexivirga oryzae]|uniref:Fatty-acyl-CoA synthase n=1 Tax=Flexivirga oryzae TaxID=1794944 RepID=A0A839N7C4_9MICO|nr:AMP-binding protein [Flexivirga oryzae]MBB2893650.1 fatty-acyl-CoA synthase [Flexivirga oryzae]
MSGLDVPLTPLRFLARTAEAYPDKTGVVDGPRRFTWREVADRTQQFARALRAAGLQPGERVVSLASNSAEQVMAHFAVPLAGGVLVATNTRLSPPEIAYILEHSEARIVLTDPDVADAAGQVLAGSGAQLVLLPAEDGSAGDPPDGFRTFDDLLSGGSAGDDLPWTVDDETSTITINYTSGTTGRPKGVMYTHRGAYLNALGQAQHQGFDADTHYLWTLPMFHCNGWCSAWGVTAAGGTHVCLRAVRGPALWGLIDGEGITHLAGAPTVLSIMGDAAEAHPLETPIRVVTAGAPPNPATLERFHELGAQITHVYGLTETYGPYTICEWQDAWDELSPRELADKLSLQGIGSSVAERARIVTSSGEDGSELTDVPADGVSLGEIVMRGNTVMKGYFKDEASTAESFAGGWFHSGDLGVQHPNWYIQVVDRSKDVIISGGENIASIEVEQALQRHPAVVDAAVIGVPDERWGEVPKAYVVLRQDAQATEAELIDHVKTLLARYKAPKSVDIRPSLPKTATGKIRKNELKEEATS